jgi:hypothetical protein
MIDRFVDDRQLFWAYGRHNTLAYACAVGLASVAAVFSIRGMIVLFPGAPIAIVAMAGMMESAKLVTAGYLAARWRDTARIWRVALASMVTGLRVLAAYCGHVGERGAVQAAVEIQDAALAAQIQLAGDKVADLDRRLSQIATAIEEATNRGRTKTAPATMEGQRKASAGLASERSRKRPAPRQVLNALGGLPRAAGRAWGGANSLRRRIIRNWRRRPPKRQFGFSFC